MNDAVESAATIADLYREHTQGAEPSEEHVAQLLALLEPGEELLFTCGWADESEKWGPPAQLSVTSRRIIDQRWSEPGQSAPAVRIALADVAAVAERPQGAGSLFATHALVVALRDGRLLQWEHLTNHQIRPAVEALEAALDGI